MGDQRRPEITRILRDLHSDKVDHRTAADRLFNAVYEELRRLATDLMRGERADHTLQSTALVHEAYLRLVDDSRIDWQNRAHFFGIAARAMRQILVDHARRHRRAKRGGGLRKITLDEKLDLEAASDVEILQLEDALVRLAEMHPRTTQVVEMRVFAGLKIKEIAHVLGLSRQTIHGDWRVAKMWLSRELAEGRAS